MKKIIRILTVISMLSFGVELYGHGLKKDDNIKSLVKYEVKIPKKVLDLGEVPEVGIGSSLSFKGVKKNGNLLFYAITDRGFNMPAPDGMNGESLKLYIDPEFSPFLGTIEVKPGHWAKLVSVDYFKINGQRITGLPPKDGEEIPVDLAYNIIKSSRTGIDCEAFDYDNRRDSFWIGEEYGPSIYQFDAKSKDMLREYSPRKGLPEILRHRQDNKGFEALAVLPNGNVMMSLEGTLDVDGQTKNSALFMRLVELDPSTGKTRMYAYPFEQGVYNKSMNAKIGDMAAISGSSILLIEQGKKGKGRMHNAIYRIDISNATDISGMKLANGKELEFGSAKELTEAGVVMVSKEMVVDPKKHGWVPEKMEGLAIIDSHHIAIMNDNDFGAYGSINGWEDSKMEDYRIDLSKGILLQNGMPSTRKMEIMPTGEKPELWVFELSKALY